MAADVASPVSYLTKNLGKPGNNLVAAVHKVATLTKTSPRSVAYNLFRNAIRKGRLPPQEYFGYGLWRPELTAGDRAAYVSSIQIRRLIKTLIATGFHDASSLMNDKYSCGLVLTANGFDNPQPIAAFSPDRAFGRLRTLTSPAELASYFADPNRPAVFGKPVNGSRSLGATPVLAVLPGATEVGLGQGRYAPIAALAQEIALAYPRGWLMQELMVQPDDVTDLIGFTIGSVRLVTLWQKDGPEPLYAVWRIAAKGSVVDAVTAGPRVIAKVDLTTGVVVHARTGTLLDGRIVGHTPSNPDRPLIGYQIPDWEKAVGLCHDAHRLFPGHAILGWDIALSDRGPLIQEINAHPLQDIYHLSHDRGFCSPDFLARFATAKQLLDARIAGYGKPVRQAEDEKTSKI